MVAEFAGRGERARVRHRGTETLSTSGIPVRSVWRR